MSAQEFENWLTESIQIMIEVVEAIEKQEQDPLRPNCTAAEKIAAIEQHHGSNLLHNRSVAEHNGKQVKSEIEKFVAKSYWHEIEPHRANIEKLRELFAMVHLNLDIDLSLVKK